MHPNIQHKESLSIAEKLALLITSNVGTMYCAGVFAVIALISLPAALSSKDPLIIVSWIAQTFLQLVLLPIIMVGQNLQNRHAEFRAEAQYQIGVDTEKYVAQILEAIAKK